MRALRTQRLPTLPQRGSALIPSANLTDLTTPGAGCWKPALSMELTVLMGARRTGVRTQGGAIIRRGSRRILPNCKKTQFPSDSLIRCFNPSSGVGKKLMVPRLICRIPIAASRSLNCSIRIGLSP